MMMMMMLKIVNDDNDDSYIYNPEHKPVTIINYHQSSSFEIQLTKLNYVGKAKVPNATGFYTPEI